MLWPYLSYCQIGPTFHFDVDEVDFGAISYDCPVSASTVLTNTSEISMVWRARVPQVRLGPKQRECKSCAPGVGESLLAVQVYIYILCATSIVIYDNNTRT